MADDYPDNYLNEDASLNGERMSGVTAGEVLTRVELDVAYCSEKALNLELLLMQVGDRACDCEAPTLGNEDMLIESVQKAFEFNILSGILNSEVTELDSFMGSLRMNIIDAGQKLSQSDHFDKLSIEIEEKLHDAEESLKQTQDLVADITMRSHKYERTLTFGNGAHEHIANGEYSPANAKGKLQNVGQQRHFLQMLEKSLARELELEKKLADSRYNGEQLKSKLCSAEREIYNLEESMEFIYERLLKAENAAEVLLGISKELTGKLQIVHFSLNGSIRRESDMRSELEENVKKLSAQESPLKKLHGSSTEHNMPCMSQASELKDKVKEAEEQCVLASYEASTLREKVTALEEQLRESHNQLELAKASIEASQEEQSMLHIKLGEMEDRIEDLREDASKSESRVESAEIKCILLAKTNLELNEQLSVFRNNGKQKADFLEKKLKESDTQLEHARASVEAIEEQQNMLYSALGDMENLIEDLKGKVSKAESRAESAESKCTLLTETNLELNEELGFLRGRLECLEASLHYANDAKMATAKDIGIRTKFISDLVLKLALERERLQIQISALTKKNQIVAEKCLKKKDNSPSNPSHRETDNGNGFSILKSPEETLTESSSTTFQVQKSIAAMPMSESSTEISVPAENSMDAIAKLETVRTTEAAQLNSKYLFTAILLLLASAFAAYLFQLEIF